MKYTRFEREFVISACIGDLIYFLVGAGATIAFHHLRAIRPE
jgi:hypothetical protein